METDFLEAFLTGLPDACGFDEDTYDLSDVRATQQIPVWDTAAGDTPNSGSLLCFWTAIRQLNRPL